MVKTPAKVRATLDHELGFFQKMEVEFLNAVGLLSPKANFLGKKKKKEKGKKKSDVTYKQRMSILIVVRPCVCFAAFKTSMM